MQVFLLTREWQHRAQGTVLSFWGTNGKQPVKLIITDQPCVCFIKAADALTDDLAGYPQQRKTLPLTTMAGEPVDGLYFATQPQLRRFSQLAGQAGIRLYESDINPADRYLMERFITASCRVIGECHQDKSGTWTAVNPRLQPVRLAPNFNWVSLDIETDIMAAALYSIAVYAADRAHVFVLGDQPLKESPAFSLSLHDTEKSLLQAFINWMQGYDPDIIMGWNVVGFDLIVLEKKCRQLGLELTLGRQCSPVKIFPSKRPGEMNIARISGRVVMDGIEMLRAAFWSFESFALDHVAQALLGEGKLITGDNKPERISELFHTDKVQLARYNLKDCRLVAEIFKVTKLIDFNVERAAMTGLAFGRVGGSVAAFDNLYLPRLHRKGCVAPDVAWQSEDTSSPGGYVMESKPGVYEDVLLLDFKSLYPSIIRTFHIDPLGMVQPGERPVPGFLNASFAREAGILPTLIEELWHKRDQAKQQHNAPLSQAIKIIMNSFYGVLGAQGCRFCDPRLTSSITRRGHEIIKRTQAYIEQQGRQVIYGDTDSIFILLESGLSPSQAIDAGMDLVRQLNDFWRENIRAEFDLPSYVEIELETHFKKFYLPTMRDSKQGSKKRYAGWVLQEGGEPALIIKGLEAVRTDWTAFARQAQTDVLTRLFTHQEVENHVLDLARGLAAGRFDEQLVYSKRLRKPLSAYTKNSPPHVQAARKMTHPGRKIDYMITLNGAEPVTNLSAKLDYDHYLNRQLKPALAGLLQCLDLDFDAIVDSQMRLF